MPRSTSPLTAKELLVLRAVEQHECATESILEQVTGLRHLELTCYLAILRGDRLVEFDEFGRRGIHQYRITRAGQVRLLGGQQLRLEALHA